MRVSDKVRAGPRGSGRVRSGRARVMEFSLYRAPVEPQAAVAGAADDDQLVAARTRGVRCLPVAELTHRAAPYTRHRAAATRPVARLDLRHPVNPHQSV